MFPRLTRPTHVVGLLIPSSPHCGNYFGINTRLSESRAATQRITLLGNFAIYMEYKLIIENHHRAHRT